MLLGKVLQPRGGRLKNRRRGADEEPHKTAPSAPALGRSMPPRCPGQPRPRGPRRGPLLCRSPAQSSRAPREGRRPGAPWQSPCHEPLALPAIARGAQPASPRVRTHAPAVLPAALRAGRRPRPPARGPCASPRPESFALSYVATHADGTGRDAGAPASCALRAPRRTKAMRPPSRRDASPIGTGRLTRKSLRR
jgi:hypothetical protein